MNIYTTTATRTDVINALMNRRFNKFYAGKLELTDIIERCETLNLDNIKPCYTLHSVHTDYICSKCDYMEGLERCYLKHTLIKKCIIQGYVAFIFIFENDQRVVYLIR